MKYKQRIKREAQKKNYINKNSIKEDTSMLFNGFGGCNKDCGEGNNTMWLLLLLLLGNCGCGISGSIDIGSLIFLLLILSYCDNGCTRPC